jgi:hypothetical protein
MSLVVEDAIMNPENLVQGNKHKSDNQGRYGMSYRVAGNWFPTLRPGNQHSKIKASR